MGSVTSMFSSLMYASEKMIACFTCTMLVTCIIATLIVILALGIGLGYNYCFVDIKTKHRYVPSGYRYPKGHRPPYYGPGPHPYPNQHPYKHPYQYPYQHPDKYPYHHPDKYPYHYPDKYPYQHPDKYPYHHPDYPYQHPDKYPYHHPNYPYQHPDKYPYHHPDYPYQYPDKYPYHHPDYPYQHPYQNPHKPRAGDHNKHLNISLPSVDAPAEEATLPLTIDTLPETVVYSENSTEVSKNLSTAALIFIKTVPINDTRELNRTSTEAYSIETNTDLDPTVEEENPDPTPEEETPDPTPEEEKPELGPPPMIIPINGLDLIALLSKLRSENRNYSLQIVTS